MRQFRGPRRRFNPETFDYREPVAQVVGQAVFSAVCLAAGSLAALYLSRFSFDPLTVAFYAAVLMAVSILIRAMVARRHVRHDRWASAEDAEYEESPAGRDYVATAFFALAIGMGGIAAAFLAVRLMEIGSLRLVTRIFAGLSAALYCGWDWRRRPDQWADSRARVINVLTIVGGSVGFVAAFD